jgi:UDPglucose 6-dehydrogenase
LDLLVVGAGYVGLTTAAVFAGLGHRVTVQDLDQARVAALNAGRSPIFEPGLDDVIAEHTAAGRLSFTTSVELAESTAVAFVCVPTPASGEGLLDTSIVESVVARLRGDLAADRTIAIRSTLPLHGPERLDAVVGAAVGPAVVINPEFMREGHALADAGKPSRVVVGWLRPADEPGARVVAGLYEPLEAPTILADARSVVLLKLASNVFLAAKIAFADELARFCDAIGADVGTVVDGLGLDPRIGRAFLEAGPGFGGSCLPEQADTIAVEASRWGLRAPLMASIGSSNRVHQEEIVATLAGAIEGGIRGARVALLGLAFKANTDDVRNSPALVLGRALREAGAEVVGYDPVAGAAARLADPALVTAGSVAEAVSGADAAVVVTEWSEFREIDWGAIATAMRGDLVYDTRRIVDARAVTDAGLRYAGLGRGGAALRSPSAAR